MVYGLASLGLSLEVNIRLDSFETFCYLCLLSYALLYNYFLINCHYYIVTSAFLHVSSAHYLHD